MKQVGEEQQEITGALNDRAVVDYLLQHPEFFIRNAALVEHMRVPHPVRGSISLVEWHMVRARNHINVLEENMMLLMEQATANESLFQRLLHLQTRLAAAESLDEMLNRFHRWAREIGLPEAKAIGSVAMSLLGGDDAPGVMLFSSRDAQHYQQGQGTQLLQEIALMLPGLLERWVERA